MAGCSFGLGVQENYVSTSGVDSSGYGTFVPKYGDGKESESAKLNHEVTFENTTNYNSPIVYVNGDAASDVDSASEEDKVVVTKFTNCTYMFGRKMVYAGDLDCPTENGTVYVKITHPTYGEASDEEDQDPETTLVAGESEPGDESSEELKSNNLYTIVPLYFLKDGLVTKSYRGMPVIPVYN